MWLLWWPERNRREDIMRERAMEDAKRRRKSKDTKD